MKTNRVFYRHSSRRTEAGVTLVEMAVVIVVIALLLISVLAGRNLSRAGRLRAVMGEIEDMRGSFVRFFDKYRDMPGDMTDASQVFGCASCDGNGNEQIVWGGSPNEGAMAWKHLQMAKMLSAAVMSGTGTTAVLSVNVPASKMPGAGYYVDYDGVGDMGNHLGFGSATGSGKNNGPSLKPEDAQNIDLKIDDGNASVGRVQGDNATTSTDCKDASGNYNFQTAVAGCYLMLKLDNQM
jgi:hypothetical protein